MYTIKPCVSVIIPTYNRSNLLKKSIETVLGQTFTDFELIIVDDCSKDDTQKVILSFNDPRIIYIKLEENQGAPFARNIGINKAKGKYVAFLDSDDQWLPEKLQKQVLTFKKNEKTGVVYTGIKKISENNVEYQTPIHRGNILSKLFINNCVDSTSTVMVKKNVLLKVNGFDLDLPSCQDWDLWIRLSLITEFDFVSEPLVNYYRHDGDRISTNFNSVLKGHLAMYNKHENLAKELPNKNEQKFYFYIGKRIFRAAIIHQNNEFTKIGRKFFLKAIKTYPFSINNYLFYTGSHINQKFLTLFYKSFLQLKKK
ncbi:glycosyltransferase [Bacillus idriensis]|uniref:Glycosyltransferase n=1 Tax=Metabacillus idriensis TaxID=324768 RepID=A0A6I2M827_9BACI|nr:glycosyltransferase family 2 protein [Metabacillus idriensis]MRX54258.1 glycosyltransferase [Metabacillus idriensis]